MTALRELVPTRHRRTIARTRVRVRTRTARWRVLPDFVVIGAMRAGTSSLYRYLGGHPDVVAPLRKEIGYFAGDWGRGLDWYRAHFPLTTRLAWHRSLHRRAALTFEATPLYLFYPHAAERADGLLPDARFVAMLREPVARAHSAYLHNARLGLEPLSFEAAVESEPERTAGLEHMWSDPAFHDRRALRYAYVARSTYAPQLEHWFDVVGRERVHVVVSEQFFSAPAAAFRTVCEFVGLRDWTPREFANHSYAGGRRPDQAETPLDPLMRARLEEHFAPHNRRLEELLGLTTGWPT